MKTIGLKNFNNYNIMILKYSKERFSLIIMFATLLCAYINAHASHNQLSMPDSITEKEANYISYKAAELVADTLGEVTVTANTITRRGNNDIFLVTRNMRKGTHNAGELLGKINGVFYNPMTMDIKYMGSNNIIILVDSIEKDEEYIKRLQPGRFDRITITNMPTGKYLGYDAVINLHTAPEHRGYEGAVLGQVLISPGKNNGQGNTLREIKGVGQFTYTDRKFNMDFSGNWKKFLQGLGYFTTSDYPLNNFTETVLETPFSRPNKNVAGMNSALDISIDYTINSRHSLTARVRAAPSWSHDRYHDSILREYHNSGEKNVFEQNKRVDNNGRLDMMYGLYYKGKLRRWNLNADMTYTDVGFNYLYAIDRSDCLSISENRHIKAKYIAGGASADSYTPNEKWQYSFSDWFSLTDYRQTNLDNNIWLSGGDYFRNRATAALYFFPASNLYVGINAGLSSEVTKEGGTRKVDIAPRCGLQFMWNNQKRRFFVRLSYSMYTSYPPLSATQTSGQFMDSLIWSVGNPNLKPALANDINVSSSFLGMFTLNARYIHLSRKAYTFFTPDYGPSSSGTEGWRAFESYVNGMCDRWELNLTFSKSLSEKWYVSATAKVKGERGVYKEFCASKLLPEYDWYIMYQTMKNTLQIYLSAAMESNYDISPQQRQWQIEDGFSMSVSKFFFFNRLQIVGMWTMPLHFCHGGWHGGMSSVPLVTSVRGNNQARSDNLLQLSVVYTFKNGKSVNKQSRRRETVEL